MPITTFLSFWHPSNTLFPISVTLYDIPLYTTLLGIFIFSIDLLETSVHITVFASVFVVLYTRPPKVNFIFLFLSFFEMLLQESIELAYN